MFNFGRKLIFGRANFIKTMTKVIVYRFHFNDPVRKRQARTIWYQSSYAAVTVKTMRLNKERPSYVKVIEGFTP